MLFDLLVVLACVGMAWLGYRRGFLISAIGIIVLACGFGAGMLLASSAGDAARGLAGMVGAMLFGGLLAFRLERVEEWGDGVLGEGTVLARIDHTLGAVLNTFFALLVVWLVGMVVALAPTSDRLSGGGSTDTPFIRGVRSSTITKAVLGVISPTGRLASAVVGGGVIPSLGGPVVIAESPDDTVLGEAGVRRAVAGVVRVEGLACREIPVGTGWVVARDLVVTNAHVVAGDERVWIVDGDRRGYDIERMPGPSKSPTGEPGFAGDVVGFDAVNDLAIIRVDRLPMPPLQQRADIPPHGDRAAILGFPGRLGLVLNAARFDRVLRYPATDIYGVHASDVDLALFRGDVRAGNSGSPIVDASGKVVATVSASAVSQAVDGGFAVPNTAVAALLTHLSNYTDTGPCLKKVGEKQ